MLNHLKSHALSYSLAAAVILFFIGQAMISNLKNETNAFAPEPVEAAIDVTPAAGFQVVLEQKNLELIAENDQLNAQYDLLNGQYGRLHKSNYKLNQENGHLHNANFILNRENGDLHEANFTLNQENSHLHQTNGELNKENQQLQEQIQRLQEIIKEKEDLTQSQKRELGQQHQQLAAYARAIDAMNAPKKEVKQTVQKKTKTDAGLVQLAKETLGVDVTVKECQ
jgi:DNA repair exonuclease SbcCD ATPase subunit